MRQRFALHGQCSWVSLLFGKPKAYFWRQHRKNQMNHEARTIIFTEKSSISFSTSCSFPVKVEAIVVKPFKWKQVSLYSSIRVLIEKDLFSLSATLPRDPFHSLANNRHQCCKWIFRIYRLSHSTRIHYYQIQYLCFTIRRVAVLLSRWHCYFCYFKFLEGRGELMALGWIFGNPGWENKRPLRVCVSASIHQRFRTVQATGYRSAQQRAWLLIQMMYFCF